MRFKNNVLRCTLASLVLAAAAVLGTGLASVPTAQANNGYSCAQGSGSESAYSFCGYGSLSAGIMQSSTVPDRTTCTVTEWEYYWPTATWVTYHEKHYVGGDTLYLTSLYNGDGNPSHYLDYNAWRRCDGSYVFSGYFAVGS